jgi:integrase
VGPERKSLIFLRFASTVYLVEEKKAKKWKKTKVQFLLQNTESSVYYARLYRDGKEVWKSLKTDVFSVAQARLAVEVKSLQQVAKVAATVESGRATVETVAKSYLDGVRLDVSLKPSSIHYREQCVTAILKTWPELNTLAPRSVTATQCEEWASRHAARYSGTRYNNAVDTLRLIFDEAIEHGLIFRNPMEDISKRPPSRKHLELPSREVFVKIVAAVRSSGAWCQVQCGDLIEFLAYSGCRIDESRHVRWVDIEADGIWIHGGKTGTKNSERRRIPIVGPMRVLLEDLRANPRYIRDESREGHVLAVRECQKALDTACADLGTKRITHHDLRHLFATRCIESGVDIPTVSRWLGHKDGGALAMRTYGHLRDEHSQRMAAKVSF